MNKAKLEVIRMANEDVIATSGEVVGLCNLYPNAKHLHSYNNEGTAAMYVDEYPASSTTRNDYGPYNYQAFYPTLNNSSAPGKWYYYNSDEGKYKECFGDHSHYTIYPH